MAEQKQPERQAPRPSQPFGPRPDADQRPGYEGESEADARKRRQDEQEKAQKEKQEKQAPVAPSGSQGRTPA